MIGASEPKFSRRWVDRWSGTYSPDRVWNVDLELELHPPFMNCVRASSYEGYSIILSFKNSTGSEIFFF